MSKHTPGPWMVRATKGAGWPTQVGYAIDFNADQEQVVDFVYEEADARLIAAAPELLEALEYALPYLEACVPRPRNGINADGSVDVNCVDRARAAIAKATGGEA